ncbi:MAG: hypothetical protein AABY65_03685 [Nitrospirota bacterium]
MAEHEAESKKEPGQADVVCERCGGKEGLIESSWMKGLYFCRECWKERGRVNRAWRGGYEDELSEE